MTDTPSWQVSGKLVGALALDAPPHIGKGCQVCRT